MKKLSSTLPLILLTAFMYGQHPRPQPQESYAACNGPGNQNLCTTNSIQNGIRSVHVKQPESVLPKGKNFLLTVDSNLYDSNGQEIPNTEPSKPPQFVTRQTTNQDGRVVEEKQVVPGTGVTFNLMSTPEMSAIDPTSPTDDLQNIFTAVLAAATNGQIDTADIQRGIDVFEGNPTPNRLYSGFPLLHINGPFKLKQVTPIYNGSQVVGGNVNVHQIWYDNHIESDTALLDAQLVWNVPWTITYTIDVLHKGNDDFSPYNLYFDIPAPGMSNTDHGPPLAGLDATFFPMQEATRYKLTIKMAPGKYFNLVYTWGWREHPPRTQAMDDVNKLASAPPLPSYPNGAVKNLNDWETSVFGTTSSWDKMTAISKIGELDPAKRMWSDLRNALGSNDSAQVTNLIQDALLSFDDWKDRTHLPRGVIASPNTDITLFYSNNTIYGSNQQHGIPNWTVRPYTYKMTLLNGDHFVHGLMTVDFGGMRGWENQFQAGFNPADDTVNGPMLSTSTGCTFTFGRSYTHIIAGGPVGAIAVEPVGADGTPGRTDVTLDLDFDPPARIKIYNFDPFHHDAAIYAVGQG